MQLKANRLYRDGRGQAIHMSNRIIGDVIYATTGVYYNISSGWPPGNPDFYTLIEELYT